MDLAASRVHKCASLCTSFCSKMDTKVQPRIHLACEKTSKCLHGCIFANFAHKLARGTGAVSDTKGQRAQSCPPKLGQKRHLLIRWRANSNATATARPSLWLTNSLWSPTVADFAPQQSPQEAPFVTGRPLLQPGQLASLKASKLVS